MAEAYESERQKDENERKRSRRVYSTSMIEKLREERGQGYDIPYDAFFEKDLDLRASGVTFRMTPEEITEYQKCYDDPVYYVENYCKFETDYGVRTVKLRDYQKKVIGIVTDETYDEKSDLYIPDNRNIIWMASRQTAKTTTISAFFSWMLCFHSDKHILVVANKEDTAKEIVRKITSVFKGLPFFMKPGCINIGKMGITLENGSLVMCSATTNTASIGFTIHCVLLDEFAHIPENIVGNFWRSVYPTLSSSKVSQCIVTSTPNGTTNKFYELWTKANKGENSFVPIRTDYWEVPEHDEAWAEKQRADFGDEEFAQEFELQFNVSARMLAKASDYKFISKIKREYVKKDIISSNPILSDPELKWHPDFNPNDISDSDAFVFLVDLSEGVGGDADKFKSKGKDPDSNTINILRLIPNSEYNMKRFSNESCSIQDAFKFEQVGVYTSNTNDEMYAGKMCAALCFDLMGADIRDNVRVLLEMNFNGNSFIMSMQKNNRFSDNVIQKTYHRQQVPGEKRRRRVGFKTSGDKEFYCLKGAKMLIKRRIIVNEENTLQQLQAFGYIKGKLKGIACHDDLSMPVFNHIPRMLQDETFIEWLTECVDRCYDEYGKYRLNNIIETWDMMNPEMSDDEFKEIYAGNIPTMYESTQYKTPFNTPQNVKIENGIIPGFGKIY